MRAPHLRHLPRTSRAKKIAAFTVASTLVGGAAFAYWTTTGAGTGAATSTTPGTIVVKQTGTAVTNVNPGRAAQTLSGNFDNPGPGTAYVTSVTASIASVTKAGGAPAGTCAASDYTLSNATVTVGADVAEGTGVGTWSGPTIAFNNKATNQDACKGATIAFSYTSS